MAELNTLTTLLADANLKAYYRMEQGAIISDSSGEGRTLTNNNSVSDTASGKYTGAADFGTSNTNKSLRVASNLGISGDQSMSFAFWLKLRTEISSGRYVIAAFITNTTQQRYFTMKYEYNSGTRRLSFDSSGSGVNYNITLGTSNWYHIVGVRNISSNTKIYVNAVEVASGTNGTTTTAGNELVIGNNVGATTEGVPAYIDDFCVFNRVLTTAEISALYTDAAATSSSSVMMII